MQQVVISNNIIKNDARYYKSDADVVQDLEIQGWANELALGAFGTANSGKGKVGYPYPMMIILI